MPSNGESNMSQATSKVIDPGAEPSAPKGTVPWLMAYIQRNPSCTLAGGEGAVLVKYITQLEGMYTWIVNNSERFYRTKDGMWWLRPLKADGSVNYDAGAVPGVAIGPFGSLDSLIIKAQA
jgi:hypothetical protein